MPVRKNAARPAEYADCHAVILAGGSGTRLWPLSRSLSPKQLLALDANGKHTLLQQTVERILPLFNPAHIWVVTNEEHVFEVRSQVKELDSALEGQVLAEPLSRSTLPAILLALDKIAAEDERQLVAVFPSDHMVQGSADWERSLSQALGLARQGRFVTFGIKPRKAETGYGYIARGEALESGAWRVSRFVEKPGLDKAEAFVRSGEYYWNSGMFFFRARDFLKAVAECQPVFWDWWLARDVTPLAQGYRDIPAESVDYGVVEKIRDIAVVEAAFRWDDLGSWEALYRLGNKDGNGNVIQGDVLALDCRDCLLLSSHGKLVAVGLTGTIMVQTRDASLTMPFAEAQRVREVVARLKDEGSTLVESHPTVRRPWGSYCVLEEGPRFKIKRLVVLPGARLSQQMHHHRSEHWVVVEGTAVVEVNGEERVLVENQSVDIPKTATHRLANPGKVPLEIIEIQSGPYLGEDDIVRFDDVYGRRKNED